MCDLGIPLGSDSMMYGPEVTINVTVPRVYCSKNSALFSCEISEGALSTYVYVTP